jgi:hypothetical protein
VVKVFDSYDGGATLQEAANTKALTFDSYGETGSSYSFTLTPGDCSDASSGKRTIEIGTTGRVSTSKLSCA